MRIAAISETAPVPEGQGTPASETQTVGTSISENRKQPAAFVERKFMTRPQFDFAEVQDVWKRVSVNKKCGTKRRGKLVGRESCRKALLGGGVVEVKEFRGPLEQIGGQVTGLIVDPAGSEVEGNPFA
jgi:hypothetical protein